MGKTRYIIGKSDDELQRLEFETALETPLSLRINNCFIKTYKPVMDDAPYRIFNSTAEYRKWCRENLPKWLGYGE
ncbi:MAG: hypothetical protein AB1546_08470 [bacterium]